MLVRWGLRAAISNSYTLVQSQPASGASPASRRNTSLDIANLEISPGWTVEEGSADNVKRAEMRMTPWEPEVHMVQFVTDCFGNVQFINPSFAYGLIEGSLYSKTGRLAGVAVSFFFIIENLFYLMRQLEQIKRFFNDFNRVLGRDIKHGLLCRKTGQ